MQTTHYNLILHCDGNSRKQLETDKANFIRNTTVIVAGNWVSRLDIFWKFSVIIGC